MTPTHNCDIVSKTEMLSPYMSGIKAEILIGICHTGAITSSTWAIYRTGTACTTL